MTDHAGAGFELPNCHADSDGAFWHDSCRSGATAVWFRWPAQGWRGDKIGLGMPGHDATSRIGGVIAGGALGCRQRSKASMMTMCPPQHGQGGR